MFRAEPMCLHTLSPSESYGSYEQLPGEDILLRMLSTEIWDLLSGVKSKPNIKSLISCSLETEDSGLQEHFRTLSLEKLLPIGKVTVPRVLRLSRKRLIALWSTMAAENGSRYFLLCCVEVLGGESGFCGVSEEVMFSAVIDCNTLFSFMASVLLQDVSLDSDRDLLMDGFFRTDRLLQWVSNLEAISSKASGDSPCFSKKRFTKQRRRSKQWTRYPILTLIPIRTSSCSFGLAIFNGSSRRATNSETWLTCRYCFPSVTNEAHFW